MPVVWLGVTLLPDVHPTLRLPMWLALAGIVGFGSELAVRQVAPEPAWRRGSGTFWFVPAGTVLLAIVWFSVFPDRPRSLAPVAVLAVLGAMLVQRTEVAGPASLRPGAHAVSIGLAFAITFAVYTTAVHAQAAWALGIVAAATALAALILLRDARASRASAFGLASVTAIVVTELALVVSSGPATPWVCAALLVLALYAASGVSHAALDVAPRHAYLELALVTVAGLIAVGIGAARG